jgi:sugar (pentulose or hexulose) kinase
VAIGLDIGTGGVRGCLIDGKGGVVDLAEDPIDRSGRHDPQRVIDAAFTVLAELSSGPAGGCAETIAVAGTSGSIVALDDSGSPIGPLSLYDDHPTPGARHRVLALGPAAFQRGASVDVVARCLDVSQRPGVSRLAFEADYVARALARRDLPTDLNNALKAGGDPVKRRWPDWLATLGLTDRVLPALVEPGQRLCAIDEGLSAKLGFSSPPAIAAGTTDGCAAALAAGLSEFGDAVTSLGTTLVLKVLSDRPVFSAEHGIYSHRMRGSWLAGGASRAGGAILRHVFGDAALETLADHPIADAPSSLSYVPLLSSGERFPVADPHLQPVLDPRPPSDNAYFLAIIDALVRWEQRGYDALTARGAPRVRRLSAVGGGTRNMAWMRTRRRDMGFARFQAQSQMTACGAARLAQSAAAPAKT